MTDLVKSNTRGKDVNVKKLLVVTLLLGGCTLPINVQQPNDQIRVDGLELRIQKLEQTKADAALVQQAFKNVGDELAKKVDKEAPKETPKK